MFLVITPTIRHRMTALRAARPQTPQPQVLLPARSALTVHEERETYEVQPLNPLAELREIIEQLRELVRTKPIESPYLTAEQAAVYLNVSYGTFRNWASDITRARTGRYHREDLDRWARRKK